MVRGDPSDAKHPLLNTYRSYCDAQAQPSIILHKSNNGMEDRVVVDLSPLRYPNEFYQVAQEWMQRAIAGDVTVVAPEIVHDATFEHELTYGDDDGNDSPTDDTHDPWASRPIYQLPPYHIVWTLPRPEAKTLGKLLASPALFATASLEKKAKSKKSIGVKPGKSRRHGGYGIG